MNAAATAQYQKPDDGTLLVCALELFIGLKVCQAQSEMRIRGHHVVHIVVGYIVAGGADQ
jgi:hypothetical protein